jgi:hypothetical protein
LYKELESKSYHSKFDYLTYLDLGNFYNNKIYQTNNQHFIQSYKCKSEIAYISSFLALKSIDNENLLTILNQYVTTITSDTNYIETIPNFYYFQKDILD